MIHVGWQLPIGRRFDNWRILPVRQGTRFVIGDHSLLYFSISLVPLIKRECLIKFDLDDKPAYLVAFYFMLHLCNRVQPGKWLTLRFAYDTSPMVHELESWIIHYWIANYRFGDIEEFKSVVLECNKNILAWIIMDKSSPQFGLH